MLKDSVKLEVLSQAYMDVRREMWSILAARVGEKWTLVEAKVSVSDSAWGQMDVRCDEESSLAD